MPCTSMADISGGGPVSLMAHTEWQPKMVRPNPPALDRVEAYI